ncbi:MAG TPA: DUF4224 domain-containing protein [Telluria sp.]
MGAFLAADDVAALTGRKIKSKQIDALKKMGLPFFVNAKGVPVVPESAVNGSGKIEPQKKAWSPPV